MKRIGIISDTHGYWDERYEQYLGECDEIWHAGDIGSMEVADRFEAMKPIFRAVHGNIDGGDVRRCYPERLRFRCEEADVLLKHIGGYPGNYDRSVAHTLYATRPLRLRPFAYPKGDARQDAESPAHQPRSGRSARLATRTNTRQADRRWQAV